MLVRSCFLSGSLPLQPGFRVQRAGVIGPDGYSRYFGLPSVEVRGLGQSSSQVFCLGEHLPKRFTSLRGHPESAVLTLRCCGQWGCSVLEVRAS